jgi:hypothetical protein
MFEVRAALEINGALREKMIAPRAWFAVIDQFRVCYAETPRWISTSLNSWS